MKRRSVGLVAASLFSLGVSSGQGNISTFFNTSSSGLAIDAQGNVYLTESSTARVRKISSGVLSTIAGNGNFGYAGDGGQAINATLSLGTGGLSGLAVDSSGNVYFSDSANHVIRKINTPGVISTYAGNGAGAGAGFGGFAGDDGPATSAKLDSPTDIAIDSNGNSFPLQAIVSRKGMHIAFPYRRLYASSRVSVTAYALIGSKISFPEISGSTHSCRASIRTLNELL